MNTRIGCDIEWDPVATFLMIPSQNYESSPEKKIAIETCQKAIDSHCDILKSTRLIKPVILRDHPGAGKTFCMLYATLYAISKELNVITTDQMAKLALQLGGKHWHNIFCLSGEENLKPHRRAKLAIVKITNKPVQLDFVICLHVISGYELGQQSA